MIVKSHEADRYVMSPPKGLTLALLQGQSVGPFPSTFQRISSGFLPDPLGGESLRLLSLGLAAAVALLALPLGCLRVD